MTSQDGVSAHETTTGHRRRSLYEELGLSADLFEGEADVPTQTSNGAGGRTTGTNGPGSALAHAGSSGRRARTTELDETESFIAALRDDSPPPPGRREHATRPAFADPGGLEGSSPPVAEAQARQAFDDPPSAFTPPAGFVPDDPSGAYDTGDLPVPRYGVGSIDSPSAGIDTGPPSRLDSPPTSGDTGPELGAAYRDESYETAYPGGPYDNESTAAVEDFEPVPPEQRRRERSLVESLLPVDALAPVDSPRHATSDGPKSADLTAESVLRQRREQPGRGWRRTVFALSGGAVNLGPSAAEVRERELINRARTPLRGCHRLAIISLKGGVGKTTTTACLGSMFAALRGDRVIAMDANPDRGTLGEKIPRTSRKTVRDLIHNSARLTRYADVREFTSQAPSRLEVIASDSDPFVSMAFSETDYRVGVGILESFYNLILTDCGTGLLHSAMVGVLGLADSLIVVSSASLDGARSASATLDWLEHHGYDDLVRGSVAVISTVHPGGGNVDVSKLADHFASRCRAVVRIPFDSHLEEGGVIELDDLEQPTHDAYLRLAAEVGDGFARPPRIG